jgi:phosphoribosylformylglycinamidine synthase
MASKRWIWEQYDRHVMGDTVDSSQSGGDAAIVRIHGTNKALAICSDCNPHYVAADPFEGGKQAVAEAYRNLSAVGATPIAITDNLNFGNPEKPDTMGVIVRAIEGMAEACRVLDFPVVSGNVSLYNETDGVGIPPTPVVGGIGLIEDVSKIATLKGAQEGDTLFLVGIPNGHLGASAYARVILGLDGPSAGAPAKTDLALEKRHAAFVRNLIKSGQVNAVHDVSDGGIACAAAEMALASGRGVWLGFDLCLAYVGNPPDANYPGPVPTMSQYYFGEGCGLYLVSAPKDRRVFGSEADGIVVIPIGHVATADQDAAGQFRFCDDVGVEISAIPLSTLRAVHEGWLPKYMRGEA